MANTKKNEYKIINNTKGSCSFKGIDDRKYLFTTPNSYKILPMNIIEGLYNECEAMITHGYLIFEDVYVYEYLGVPKEVYERLIPLDKLEAILNLDAEEMSNRIDEMPKPIQENLVSVAKEIGLDSKKKTRIIKEKTGFDVSNDEE